MKIKLGPTPIVSIMKKDDDSNSDKQSNRTSYPGFIHYTYFSRNIILTYYIQLNFNISALFITSCEYDKKKEHLEDFFKLFFTPKN